MVIVDTRSPEQLHVDNMEHASIVSIRHATGHFTANGCALYDEASCARDYAKIAAHHAFFLHPELRDPEVILQHAMDHVAVRWHAQASGWTPQAMALQHAHVLLTTAMRELRSTR